MSTLKQSVHDYLALRRSLGFKLRAAEDALAEFVVFAEQRGITRITAAIAARGQEIVPSARVDIDRIDFDAVLACIAHDLGRRVKTHGL